MVTVQVAPAYEAHPDQLFTIQSAAGAAVSVTVSPFAAVVLHPSGVVALHAMPGPVTVPFPVNATFSG